MAILVDKLIDVKEEIDGKWYIAKPLQYTSFFKRFKDAIKVLNGEFSAVYFYKDKVKDQV